MNRFTLLLLALAGPAVKGQAQQSYLPLVVGNRWELVSSADRKPMVYEVTQEKGGSYLVRWENPFVAGVVYGFRPETGGVSISSLNLGSGDMNLPEGIMYFDFSQSPGGTWKNILGQFTLVSRTVSVDTPAGAYSNCIHIQYKTKDKSVTDYFLAPGVGFAQIGAGATAYKLKSFSTGRPSAGAPPKVSPATPPPKGLKAASSVPGVGQTLVSVEVNVPAGGGPADYQKWFQKVYDMGGVRHLQASPIWNQVETKAGRYNLASVDRVFPVADSYKIPVYLNFRVVDTNRLALPQYLQSRKFDDPGVLTAFGKMVDAVAARSRGTVKWVSIGNEVDSYLLDHREAIPAYAKFLEGASAKVRQVFPDAAVTVNLTFGALREWDGVLRPIVEFCDFASFTYYPLNADFSLRDPGGTQADIEKMISAAGTKPVFVQEIGYSSDSLIGASEAKQALFLEKSFAALQTNRSKIIGTYFVWMFDLDEKTLRDLTRYYKMDGADRFAAYLGTLGMFDRSGKPKQAWAVFEREVGRIPR
jgi:hypothetical protein